MPRKGLAVHERIETQIKAIRHALEHNAGGDQTTTVEELLGLLEKRFLDEKLYGRTERPKAQHDG